MPALIDLRLCLYPHSSGPLAKEIVDLSALDEELVSISLIDGGGEVIWIRRCQYVF